MKRIDLNQITGIYPANQGDKTHYNEEFAQFLKEEYIDPLEICGLKFRGTISYRTEDEEIHLLHFDSEPGFLHETPKLKDLIKGVRGEGDYSKLTFYSGTALLTIIASQ